MRSKRIALLGVLVLVFIGLLSAQTDTGRIVGSVLDTSGAVVQGAAITVRNERTGHERKVLSNDQGAFIITQLSPASYLVTTRAEGFGVTETRDVQVQVGQERAVNIVLQPASVTTEVNVSGGELVNIDVSSARMGVNVSSREVSQLPLNGRQISQLYLLSPGTVINGSGTFDDIRFNGRSNEQNIIRFDGIEGTSIVDTSPGNLNGEISSQFRLQTSLENVQEFRVESSNYPAEYGTGTGGQISIITKSGSNRLHGSWFEYLRNDALDARNFFDASKGKLRVNQFGGSVGGPIVKDKAFFFGSYEGLRQRVGIPFVETTPSLAARARAVPAIQPLLAAFPIGQTPSTSSDFDVVQVTGRSQVNESAGGIRFDYSFSDKYRLYARYFRDQGDFFAHQNSTLSAYTVSAVPQNGVLSFSQVLSSSIINETKFGFNGSKTRVDAIAPQIPGLDLTGVTINITGSVALSGIAGQAGSAGVAIPTGLVRANSATNGRGQPYTNYSSSFIDSLSVIHGNHSMKFGLEVVPRRLYTDRLGGTTYTFSNLNDFLGNRPSSIQYLGDVSAPSPFTGLSGNLNLYYGPGQTEDQLQPAESDRISTTISSGARLPIRWILRPSGRATTSMIPTSSSSRARTRRATGCRKESCSTPRRCSNNWRPMPF